MLNVFKLIEIDNSRGSLQFQVKLGEGGGGFDCSVLKFRGQL